MIKIGFCNLKGGVGKTTACQNIAAGLAKHGRKVAVIDMDPQSNLSSGFGIMPSPSEPQVFNLLSGESSWDDIVSTKEDVDIIPSSLNLVMAELNNKGPLNHDSALRDAVNKIDPDRYDYILMDSPPQLGIFTRNVLTACDKIIVPMDGGFYSLLGLKLLDSALPVFREKLNPELEIAGVLMTNYNPRLYIARQVVDYVKKNFADAFFESYIRQNVSIVEAGSMGMSIFAYDAKSKGAACYEAVTAEFLKKFEGYEPEPQPQDKKPELHTQPEEPEPQPRYKELEPQVQHEEPKPEAQAEEEKSKTEQMPLDSAEPEPEAQAEEEKPETEQMLLDNAEPELPVEIPDGPLGEVVSLLPEDKRKMWIDMLAPMMITKRRLNIDNLRDDFEDSDKSRFTFYVLNDEENNLWPVMLSEQIDDSLTCALKLDENEGWAELYI